MSRSNGCLYCKLIGGVISAIVAVVIALIITGTAYAWVQYLLMCSWTFIALVLLGALIITLIQTYKRNQNIREQLCRNVKLLTIGTMGLLITTAIFSLLLTQSTILVVLFQILVGLTVFFIGLTLTAVLCFIIGLIVSHCRCHDDC